MHVRKGYDAIAACEDTSRVVEMLGIGDLLDRRPGAREAGAVLTARVVRHHDDGLSELDANGVALLQPRVGQARGKQIRLRIAAHEVIPAKTRPTDLLALNILPGTVREVRAGGGPGANRRAGYGGGRNPRAHHPPFRRHDGAAPRCQGLCHHQVRRRRARGCRTLPNRPVAQHSGASAGGRPGHDMSAG